MSNQGSRHTTGAPSGSSSDDRPYRRRLSNYLLDKSLQLRYVGFVTVLSAFICGTLGYLIWQQEHMASAQVLAAVDDTLCSMLDTAQCNEIKAELNDDFTRHDTNLVLQMVAVGLGLGLVLFLYLVVMTHKVAGPLYKVSLYFEKMAQGRLGPTYPLRKGDMMQDFYEKFEDMHAAVRERFQSDNQVIGRFLETCNQSGVSRQGALGHLLDELETHHREREQALQ